MKSEKADEQIFIQNVHNNKIYLYASDGCGGGNGVYVCVCMMVVSDSGVYECGSCVYDGSGGVVGCVRMV